MPEASPTGDIVKTTSSPGRSERDAITTSIAAASRCPAADASAEARMTGAVTAAAIARAVVMDRLLRRDFRRRRTRFASALNAGSSVASTCCSRSVCTFNSGAEVLEDRRRIADRLAVAGVDDAEQRREPVVDLDREVERILAALVLAPGRSSSSTALRFAVSRSPAALAARPATWSGDPSPDP